MAFMPPEPADLGPDPAVDSMADKDPACCDRCLASLPTGLGTGGGSQSLSESDFEAEGPEDQDAAPSGHRVGLSDWHAIVAVLAGWKAAVAPAVAAWTLGLDGGRHAADGGACLMAAVRARLASLGVAADDDEDAAHGSGIAPETDPEEALLLRAMQDAHGRARVAAYATGVFRELLSHLPSAARPAGGSGAPPHAQAPLLLLLPAAVLHAEVRDCINLCMLSNSLCSTVFSRSQAM